MAFIHKAGAVPTGYGGGDHWLVHADVPTWMATIEKAVKGEPASAAAWSAFRAQAPEIERLALQYWDRDYGETLAKLDKARPIVRDSRIKPPPPVRKPAPGRDDYAALRSMAMYGSDANTRDQAWRKLRQAGYSVSHVMRNASE
jgi:hypothetical protein